MQARHLFGRPAERAVALDWAGMQRVLAVPPDGIGEVILLTPALRALRRVAPEARLDLLASPTASGLRPLLPDIDGVLTVMPSWQQTGVPAAADRLASAEEALVHMVAARGYDAVLAFTGPYQSPWPALHVALLAGVPVRIGQSREFAGALATHPVTPLPEHAHQVDRCLHLLAAAGVPATDRRPVLRVPAAAAQEATELLPGVPFALLAPGTSGSARRGSAGWFGAVAARLAHAGLPVLVTGTEAEQFRVRQVVQAAADRRVSALPVLDLARTAAVTAAAAVAVTTNSGAMHLAEALGTPVTVAWSGTERIGHTAPRAVPSAVFTTPVSGSPGRPCTCRWGEECGDEECRDLDPGRLAGAALELAGRPVSADPEEHTCPASGKPAAAR